MGCSRRSTGSSGTTTRAYRSILPRPSWKQFYYGFCNDTIWPLFHYFPSYARYEKEMWDSYRIINEKYLENVMRSPNRTTSSGFTTIS